MKFPRILIFLAFVLVTIAYFAFTDGHLLPRHMGKIESLHAPITLTGWSDAGLQAAGGRTIPVPGIRHLPATSLVLTEATKRGLEITPDGRLFCLVRIFHWCGNDPITADIRRIDLSDMLIYLQIGEPTDPVLNPKFLAHIPGGSFHQDSGWNVSEHGRFYMWQSSKNEILEP